MSRSFERQVRRNSESVAKSRKKYGLHDPFSKSNPKRFTGRNYILPFVLIMFIGLYNVIRFMDINFEPDTIYWLTIVSYFALAALFFFRKPYLVIGKDYVQSRRMMGDKQLYPSGIKEIKSLSGYVVIVPVKGPSWTYSKMFNRFPVDDMKEKLKLFAQEHNITFTEQ